MGLIAKDKGEYSLIDEGTHPARCYLVADIGTQVSQFGEAHQCVIGWEVWPTESPDPDTIHAFYTVSLNAKANLRKALTGWRGKAFTEEELAGFNLAKLLTAPCQLTITHKETGEGKKRAIVSSIASAARVQVPDLVGQTILIEEPTDDLSILPDSLDWLAKRIAECVELKGNHKTNGAAKPQADTKDAPDDDDDNIPF